MQCITCNVCACVIIIFNISVHDVGMVVVEESVEFLMLAGWLEV